MLPAGEQDAVEL